MNKVDEANRLATSCSNKSDIVCTSQVDDNKLVATCYEQPVLVLLEQLVASLLPSSILW